MGIVLQFPIKKLTDFPSFDWFYFTPSWLRDLSESSSNLNRIDRGLLSLFIFHTNHDSISKIDMEYVLEEFGLPNIPITKWEIDSSYNKLIRLGYIDMETKEWTKLLPWIPQSEIDRVWAIYCRPGKHGSPPPSDEKIFFRIFRGGQLRPNPEAQKESGGPPNPSNPAEASSNSRKQKKTAAGNRQTRNDTNNKSNHGRSKKTRS